MSENNKSWRSERSRKGFIVADLPEDGKLWPLEMAVGRQFFRAEIFMPQQDCLVNGQTENVCVVEVGGNIGGGKGLEAKRFFRKNERIFGAHGVVREIREALEEKLTHLEDQTADQTLDSILNVTGNPDLCFPNAITIDQFLVEDQSQRRLEPRPDNPFNSQDPLDSFVPVYPSNVILNPNADNPLRYLNHSCQPNVMRFGATTFVAMGDILPASPLTADYSTLEVNPAWEMKCGCGCSNCRGEIRSVQSLSPQQIFKFWSGLPTFMKRIYLKNIEQRFKGEDDIKVIETLKSTDNYVL